MPRARTVATRATTLQPHGTLGHHNVVHIVATRRSRAKENVMEAVAAVMLGSVVLYVLQQIEDLTTRV